MAWGFVSRLGKAISSGVSKIGKTVTSGVDTGIRLGKKAVSAVVNAAPSVDKIAGKVGEYAGMVSKGAALAAGVTQEIPFLGAGLDAVAAGGKVVQGAAGTVQKGAKMVERASALKKAMR
eukprot:SAG31_NODE_3425_length_4290_cov_171.943927_3_plen_120_part_00